MRALGSFSTVLLHRLPVDGRKQINGLTQIIKDEMGENPFGEALFVFTTKSRNVLRLIYWDRTGFAMWVKRLEKDRFCWPVKHDDDVVSLSEQELGWLLGGFDILKHKPHKTLQYSSI